MPLVANTPTTVQCHFPSSVRRMVELRIDETPFTAKNGHRVHNDNRLASYAASRTENSSRVANI